MIISRVCSRESAWDGRHGRDHVVPCRVVAWRVMFVFFYGEGRKDWLVAGMM